MLYSVVSFEDFHRLFAAYKRNGQFSNEGLFTLFSYLDDLYENTTHRVDVIALCCEWAEYPSVQELLENYLYEYSSEELHDEGMKLLRDEHTVLNLPNGKGFLVSV